MDPEHGLIVVLEVKDPYEAFSPRQVSNRIDAFTGTSTRPGYIQTLRQKVADVESSRDSVAAALGAPVAATQWSVVGAMVTRHPVPAAFAKTGVHFGIVDDLAELVERLRRGAGASEHAT